MEERNIRKHFEGVVVSDKMDKTITVAVDTFDTEKIYMKRVKKTTKFHVHDEENKAQVGDKVVFMEARPPSKTKKDTLVKIVKTKETI